MKIISGNSKGRKLAMPKGIRPTQNKVRKALFDILGDISGLSFLELFAGSGAIGFEALSKGVTELIFVEEKRDCVAAIKKNISALKAQNCQIFQKDAQEAIPFFHHQGKRFELIFLDPPYYLELAKKTLRNLSTCDILAPNGFIIVQHFKKDDLPAQLGVLSLFKQSHYGDTSLSFYKKDVPKSDLSGKF